MLQSVRSELKAQSISNSERHKTWQFKSNPRNEAMYVYMEMPIWLWTMIGKDTNRILWTLGTYGKRQNHVQVK